MVLKYRNQIEMCRAVCSAGGDVNKQEEEEFGSTDALIKTLGLFSHCIQQTEGMKIKLWANYTFLQIVICLFFLNFYTAVGVFFFIRCVVLFCSEVNWPGLENTPMRSSEKSQLLDYHFEYSKVSAAVFAPAWPKRNSGHFLSYFWDDLSGSVPRKNSQTLF